MGDVEITRIIMQNIEKTLMQQQKNNFIYCSIDRYCCGSSQHLGGKVKALMLQIRNYYYADVHWLIKFRKIACNVVIIASRKNENSYGSQY